MPPEETPIVAPVVSPVVAPPVVPPVPKVEVAPKVEPSTQTQKRVSLKGDEDIPDDADLIEMSPRAFKSKLSRHTASELKKRFGTDDHEKILGDLKELETLRADKEKARQSQLTKEQQLEEKAQKAETRAQAAETRARQVEEARTYEKEDSRMSRLAAKFLDEDHVDVELTRFAKHLTDNFPRKDLERMKPKEIEAEATRYFEERVKAKPKIGREYEKQRDAQMREDIKAELAGRAPRKVTNGGTVGKPEGSKEKSAAEVIPGKLSPDELRKWKRANNMNW